MYDTFIETINQSTILFWQINTSQKILFTERSFLSIFD